MFTLSTTIELPIAHRLPTAYSGLCVGNLDKFGNKLSLPDSVGIVHGHNYLVTVELSTDTVNDDFMVMDFKKVKRLIHQELDQYDHSLILTLGDALIDWYQLNFEAANVDPALTRLFVWSHAPTAEYMAYKWYKTFKTLFADAGINLNKLTIVVEETSHNKVSYTEG